MGLGDRLRAIADDPCPPDIIGVNHYLTSDRFLDHRLDRYPTHLHGGNERQRYADTEALRARRAPPAGLGGALREVWRRYRTAMAITEVHNGSTRDEQLRWAAQAWDTARAVAAEGADIRAVTAWSLLGSHGWDTLLRADGSYEPGVFDVTDGVPRETALAALWRGLPLDQPRHPVASEPGWWQRPERRIYGKPLPPTDARPGRPLLICAEAGIPRETIVEACASRAIRHMIVDQAAAITTLVRTTDAWGVFSTKRHRPVADACSTAGIPCSALTADILAPSQAHAALDDLIDRAA
jgi:dTDP-4-dehydrorhamnose reductase